MSSNCMWHYRGQQRPDFADAPEPGQESVWDYPRPPALRPDERLVEVFHGEHLLARTRGSVRILETASPPTFYLPPDDVHWDLLEHVAGSSFCEWKGAARYYALAGSLTPAGDPLAGHPVGWCYPDPTPAFATIAGWPSFYPGRVSCRVDGEAVQPQPGGFYGGWLTNEIVGPVKGTPGTGHW
ncbi:MAG: DUF427 domain-containing protein [Pseudomonadota bacterium]